MKYYIEIGTVNKAKQDIDEVCRREGMANLTRCNFGDGNVGRFMTKLVAVASIVWRLHKGDTLFLQYPMKKFYKLACTLAQWRGARVVTIVHDLGAFRRHKLSPEQENRRLSKTDFLIVHNPTMEQYLRQHGFSGGMHCLQIFDYLSDRQPAAYATPHSPWRVVYAGNLARWRNAFLYKLDGHLKGWTIDLYGKGFETASKSVTNGTPLPLTSHGFKASDDFIAETEADFGLVWDGDSLHECTGDWGEYLLINDPHKTSFYLRAAIPVIVWSKAAMAPFILEQGVGIAVDGIDQIASRLSALSPEAYAQMKHNARLMGQRLNDGHYVKAAMLAADKFLTTK